MPYCNGHFDECQTVTVILLNVIRHLFVILLEVIQLNDECHSVE
jgi:hypothetical protein